MGESGLVELEGEPGVDRAWWTECDGECVVVYVGAVTVAEEELRVEREPEKPMLDEDGNEAFEFVKSGSSSKSMSKLEGGRCNGEDTVEAGLECIAWNEKPISAAFDLCSTDEDEANKRGLKDDKAFDESVVSPSIGDDKYVEREVGHHMFIMLSAGISFPAWSPLNDG